MFIQDLLRALASAQVRYCVVGGVAVNLHGVPRMTYDVDLVVPTTTADLAAVDAVLIGLGLKRAAGRAQDLADLVHLERLVRGLDG